MSRLLGPLLLKNRRFWGWFVPKNFQWLHFLFSGSVIWWTAFWVICPWNEFEETEQCAKDCKYYDFSCKSKTCFICSWQDNPVFNLRGLCTKTQVHNQFVLLPEKTFGGNVYFFGIRNNNILFNQETSSWLIVTNATKEIFKPGGISTDSLIVVGTFKPDQSNVHHLPVGTWQKIATKSCNWN